MAFENLWHRVVECRHHLHTTLGWCAKDEVIVLLVGDRAGTVDCAVMHQGQSACCVIFVVLCEKL